MSQIKPVPDIVIGRLPIYLRALSHLLDEGQRITASKELAERLGISSAQIRKDLSHFGEFGKQGMGYDIAYLREQLKGILKVDQIWDMVLVGAGDLGHAIIHYGGFEGRGFRVKPPPRGPAGPAAPSWPSSATPPTPNHPPWGTRPGT